MPEAGQLMSGGDATLPRYLIWGALVVLALFGGLGGWAAFASIAGAVIAPASIVVESNSKKVQHLDGGIVGEIRVKDGDLVRPGDLVMRLDDTVPRANLAIVTKQLDELIARQARLEAEREEAPAVTIPPVLRGRLGEAHVAKVVAGQTKLFVARREAIAGQRAQLYKRIAQLRDEIQGLEAQRTAKGAEIALIEDELEGLLGLEKRGLVPKTRVMKLKREAARLEGERGRFAAETARAEGRIGETEIKIIQLARDRRAEVVAELREVQSKIAELAERRVAALDTLKRIDIAAPIGGFVHDLAFHTIGGVVPAGETILQIVPSKDVLIIEARLEPKDVDQVRVGQTALIRFPSFNQRTTPELNATVRHVSADLSRDARQQIDYYKVRLLLDAGEARRLQGKALVPGMPADVFIQTDRRTALSYLVKPLTDQLQKAFREE